MITVTFDGGLSREIDRWRHQLDRAVDHGLEQIGERGEATLRGLAPRGPTGNFEEEIGHEVDLSARTVTVGSKARHAHLVEDGRPAGRMPPPLKIMAILGVTRAEAYPIARSIGRSGTPGAKVVELTARTMRDDVDRIGRQILEDIHR